MPRNVEVKLDRKIVLPLVDLIRQQVSKLERSINNGTSSPVGHRRLTPPDLLDLQTLTDLFHPDFSNFPVIRLSQVEAPAILRACTMLRFDLRDGPLASFSDAAMESGKELVPDSVSDELRPIVMCYLFLATIQKLALEHFDLPAAHSASSGIPFWARLLSRSKRQQPGAASPTDSSAAHPAARSWQVVVANDPVNLMNYVSSVLRHLIGLSTNDAIKRMREVHELKESIVWTGEKEKAEVYVAALQSWHLNAALRPAVRGPLGVP